MTTPPPPRHKIPLPEWEELPDLPADPTTTSTDKRYETGEHVRRSITELGVVRGNGGQLRL